MTKKDYIKIAKIIKDNTHAINLIVVLNKDNLIHDLVLMFEDDNNIFDRDRFINACE